MGMPAEDHQRLETPEYRNTEGIKDMSTLTLETPSAHSARMTDAADTRTLNLNNGQAAIVDASLYEWLSGFDWSAQFSRRTKAWYIVRTNVWNGKQQQVRMERQVIGRVRGERCTVEFINGDTLDMRRSNLRVTQVR